MKKHDSSLYLFVLPQDKDAMAFWKRLGYDVVNTVELLKDLKGMPLDEGLLTIEILGEGFRIFEWKGESFTDEERRFIELLKEFCESGGTKKEFLELVNRALEGVTGVRVKPLENESERHACLDIARALPEWFNDAGLKAMERDLKSETTFIAVENGRVLGFITVKPIDKKALEILWMAVKREFRGKGIGTEMLRFVERWAEERNFEILVVKTSGDLSYEPYDETRRFYERRGFVRVALIDPYPEWDEEALIYAKCLKSER